MAEQKERHTRFRNNRGLRDKVAVLHCGAADPFTYSLSELETSKQFMHGRIQFALVFKDR